MYSSGAAGPLGDSRLSSAKGTVPEMGDGMHKQIGQAHPRDLSEFGAALNMLKFIIGLGIISLPEATKHVGWLPSIIGLGVVAFVTVWGIFFALQAREKLDAMEEAGRAEARTLSEGDPLINSQTCSWKDIPDYGCGFFDKIVGKVWGPAAQTVFVASIALGQFTTLVIYLNVITDNFDSYLHGSISHFTIFIGVIFILGVFSLIPTLRGVTVLSAVGLAMYFFLFFGLISELAHKSAGGSLPADAVMVRPLAESSYGQWFGISCFAFSGFPIAQVIYEEMINQHNFRIVVSGVFASVWLAYSSFALLGFLCFGHDTNVLVYFNFEEGSVFRNGSSVALGCILCFSFIVQAMPVFNCSARVCEHTGISKAMGLAGIPVLAVRWIVLAAVAVAAYAVPSVRVMMDTGGAVSGVLAGFVFPAVTFLKLSSGDEWLSRLRCFIILGIGVTGALYSCTGR